MDECACVAWIQGLPVPGKVIILKCSVCRTDYTLYPNGTIAFEQLSDLFISPSRSKQT